MRPNIFSNGNYFQANSERTDTLVILKLLHAVIGIIKT